jgi:D-alanyl-D-alanine carboxypeptidase
MTPKFKIFLTALVLSLPFWWGINLLEKNLKDFFFWHNISQNPQIFAAQVALEEELRNLKPIRDKNVEDLKVNAKSAISFFLNNEGKERVLFGKEIDKKLPIASLTKLMTANVVLKNYDLSKKIKISKEAVAQEENFGKLEVGKVFPAGYLLYPLLMESSNDAAFALANDYNGMSERKFIALMNWEGKKLNLNNTFFDNPTGLDPEESGTELNYSTARDLVKLTKELLKEPLIWQILSTPKYTLYGPELINTDKLLGEISGIVGGKTGYTEMSGGCILLVTKAPKNSGYLINVILGANGQEDRFGEMKKLVNWLDKAYKW